MQKVFQKMHIDATSKYGITQKVFFMRDNRANSDEVYRIQYGTANSTGSGMDENGVQSPARFVYQLRGGLYLNEDQLYGSKEDLLKSL